MAFAFGQFNEFSDSVTRHDPVIEAVARAINIGTFKGRFFQAMGAPAATITQKAFEVYTRSKTSRNGTIDANWDDDDTTGLGVSDSSLNGLTIGHVLDIGGEIVVISGINRSAGTISVYKRGDGGSTAAAHSSGAAFEVIGFAGNDTDLKNVESMTESTSKWENYVQTVFEVIDWTKHGELTRKGLDSANATALLIQEAQIRVAELLSIMAIRGVKAKAISDATRYMSAGLLAQLSDTTNRGARTYDVNGVLTETKFKAALKNLFDNGGTANTIWVSPTCKEYINAFLGANSMVTLTADASKHTAGGVYVDSYNYEGKILQVEVDVDMPNDKIAIVNQAKCKKGWLSDDGLRLVDEPTKSSREKRKSLQGSLGFLIEDVGVDHILLTGITGGSTDRVHKVNVTNPNTPQITEVSADVEAASAANKGTIVLIATGWSGGTNIETAVAGEFWASNGTAWVKLG